MTKARRTRVVSKKTGVESKKIEVEERPKPFQDEGRERRGLKEVRGDESARKVSADRKTRQGVPRGRE